MDDDDALLARRRVRRWAAAGAGVGGSGGSHAAARGRREHGKGRGWGGGRVPWSSCLRGLPQYVESVGRGSRPIDF